jgi:hypothetical protein
VRVGRLAVLMGIVGGLWWLFWSLCVKNRAEEGKDPLIPFLPRSGLTYYYIVHVINLLVTICGILLLTSLPPEVFSLDACLEEIYLFRYLIGFVLVVVALNVSATPYYICSVLLPLSFGFSSNHRSPIHYLTGGGSICARLRLLERPLFNCIARWYVGSQTL